MQSFKYFTTHIASWLRHLNFKFKSILHLSNFKPILHLNNFKPILHLSIFLSVLYLISHLVLFQLLQLQFKMKKALFIVI